MLIHLDIENIAVIEKLNIDLKDGMSVLTGETGAGKSIIIDSINLILGARTNKDLVRYGEKKARVQAVFEINEALIPYISSLGIDTEDNQLIIAREISEDGKSSCRINGMLTTTAVLRELAGCLVNIHGQHDNQALLTSARHIDFLDKFAQNEKLADEYAKIYHQVKDIRQKLDKLNMEETERMQRMDLLKFQVDEIKGARLRIDEDAQLAEERDIIANAEKISLALNEAYENVYEGGDIQSAYDGISIAVNALGAIAEFDGHLKEIYDRLSDIMYNLEDAAHELNEYGANVEYDENRLNEVEERLDLISKLKRKYGKTIAEILSFYEKANLELEELSERSEKIAELNIEYEAALGKLAQAGQKLSRSRQEAGVLLQKQIEDSLAELDMPKARFCVNISQNKEFCANGADSVEFLISTNSGEPLKPLAKVASGGELSRVMLAIKSILADADEVDTLIFDEIDTGVSGNAAQKIAVKLSQIAKNKQVICITHLAGLAAMADTHFLIRKNVYDEKTVTDLIELDLRDRERELARIIDGENITDTALKHAQEMLKNARENKAIHGRRRKD